MSRKTEKKDARVERSIFTVTARDRARSRSSIGFVDIRDLRIRDVVDNAPPISDEQIRNLADYMIRKD